MKKLNSLLVMLLCVSSIFATRYLIQPGTAGAAEWRTVEAGETLIDLTVEGKTLETVLNALSVVNDDEVWIIKGVYTGWTTGFTPAAAKATYAGGFAGTETALTGRAVGNKSWEFTNETVWDGVDYTKVFLNPAAYRTCNIDGITLTRGGGTNGPIFNRATILNCKIIDNKGAGQSAAVRFYGQGHLKNCYIANNINSHATAVNQLGGGIYINANAQNITIDGCVIEGNTANSGGGIHIQGVANSTVTITNSIIQGNSANAGSAINITNNIPVVVLANCVIANNGNAGAIAQMRKADMHYCTVVNNIGNRVELEDASSLKNCVFHYNMTAGNSHTNITAKTGTFENCAYTGPDNFTSITNIKLAVDNEANSGPWFINPTSFRGVPATADQWTELRTANWSINNGSALIGKGDATLSPTFTTDINGATRSTSASSIGAYEKDVSVKLNNSLETKTSMFVFGKTLNVLTENNADITIFSASGQKVLNKNIDNNFSYDLNTGIYIVKVANKLGTSTSKVIVQ